VGGGTPSEGGFTHFFVPEPKEIFAGLQKAGMPRAYLSAAPRRVAVAGSDAPDAAEELARSCYCRAGFYKTDGESLSPLDFQTPSGGRNPTTQQLGSSAWWSQCAGGAGSSSLPCLGCRKLRLRVQSPGKAPRNPFSIPRA